MPFEFPDEFSEIDRSLMETLIYENNEPAALHIQWDTMEKMQDAMPNVEWGWYGYVLMLFYRYGE